MKRALLGGLVVLGLSLQLGVGVKILCDASHSLDDADASSVARADAWARQRASADARAAEERLVAAKRAFAALEAEREASRADGQTLAALERARERLKAEIALERRQVAEARGGISFSSEADLTEDLDSEISFAAARVSRRGMGGEVGALRGSAIAASEETAFASVQEAVLTGDVQKSRAAIRDFNDSAARTGAPLVLFPEDAERAGVTVRASYAGQRSSARFAVTLLASTTESEARVVIPPGTVIKGQGDGQDTSVVDVTVLSARPDSRDRVDPTICCVEIGKNDPRSRAPGAVTTHKRREVGLVAAAAARTRSEWIPTQVALWAVANDATREQVEHAPGPYTFGIEPARDLLESAGIDTNVLPLYQGEQPRPRAGQLLTAPRLGLGGRG
jgi:hypothetical protein